MGTFILKTINEQLTSEAPSDTTESRLESSRSSLQRPELTGVGYLIALCDR